MLTLIKNYKTLIDEANGLLSIVVDIKEYDLLNFKGKDLYYGVDYISQELKFYEKDNKKSGFTFVFANPDNEDFYKEIFYYAVKSLSINIIVGSLEELNHTNAYLIHGELEHS